ncbi:MAG: GNAT family N-acetyltransferase [Methanosarcinaceae archaeon]|nr:GNAT family N-acetyltransferase [Methanosarcinaceae archaeon]
MNTTFNVRPLKKEDCREVARIRFEIQEWGFLPSLGVDFLSELLKGTCESKWGFGIACLDKKEKIAGFVFATTDLKKYYRDILFRRGALMAFFAFLRLLQKPDLIHGIVQYLGYPDKMSHDAIKAEWLTMVVREEYRNKKIGNILTSSLIEEFRKRGVKQFKSTVASKNEISCRIHVRYGFKFMRTFNLHGEEINVYKYII